MGRSYQALVHAAVWLQPAAAADCTAHEDASGFGL